MITNKYFLKGIFVMKKNFALFLALVMIASCFFSIAPAADATAGGGASSESYEPSIAYANVNYSEDLILMFAVPASNSLEEGSSVKVVVWDAPSAAYSYKDALTTQTALASATALKAEENKATIGGVEHLVFKYKLPDPKNMTDVIYARPVVVNGDDKATAYGDVLDYSVVEYIQTAKGAFSAYGAPAIVNEEVLALLDSILDFGAFMQTFRGENETHIPNGFLANDELHKIWITPVVGGKTFDKVFGGFFKYEEDGYANLYEPFYDGYKAAAYMDLEGNALIDAYPGDYDEAYGFQLDAVDGDIEVMVEYELSAVRELNASDFGEGFAVNNLEKGFKGAPEILTALGCDYGNVTGVSLKSDMKINFSAAAGSASSIYAGFKTVPDPDDESKHVLLVTATNAPVLSFAQPLTIADYNQYGYGDTVDEAISMEFELGRPSPDSIVKTSYFFIMNTSSWAKSEGHATAQTRIYLLGIENNKVVTDNGMTVCELPEVGTVKVGLTISSEGVVEYYYRNADGEMIAGPVWDMITVESHYNFSMPKEYKDKHAKHLANLADEDPTNDETYLPYANFANFLTMNSFEAAWTFGKNLNKYNISTFDEGTVEMGGQTVPVKDENGYNIAAAQLYAEQTCSVLLKSWRVYIGDIYSNKLNDVFGDEAGEEKDGSTLVSVTGEDFGPGFAFSNLTSKIGVYDGYPAVIQGIGATHDPASPLNSYRFEHLFRRAWFDGNIGGAKFFQGFKTVADPQNPGNLVLQITSANQNTLDLETIKPEELANAGWGADGAITLELEIGKPNPNISVNTRVFQIHRRTDENPDAAFKGNSQIELFKVINDEILFYGESDTVIGEVPDTGFVKIAFVISGSGVIKAYCSDASGAMVYAGEKDFSQLAMFASEDFASWMNHVITPRWYVGSGLGDAATIQAATVEIDGAQVPVYADGAYNEAALQLYMEQNHSFLLDNFKISGGAIYE